MKLVCYFFTFFIAIHQVNAQNDTIRISEKNIQVKNVKQGTSVYLVYVKMTPDATRSFVQFWTRDVKKTTYNGVDAFEISQSWEDKDTIMHTSQSICEANSFRSLYHTSWWKTRGTQTYEPLTKTLIVNNRMISDTTTNIKSKAAWNSFQSSWDTYFLNWHIDLEVFQLMKYKKQITLAIPFYEFGYDKPTEIYYSVIGEASLQSYDNKKVACWILQHESEGNVETYWISKATNEVLKLEQKINDQMMRYKIKFGFSDVTGG